MNLYKVLVFFHDGYIPTGQVIRANNVDEAFAQLRWIFRGINLKQLNKMYELEQQLSISDHSEDLT